MLRYNRNRYGLHWHLLQALPTGLQRRAGRIEKTMDLCSPVRVIATIHGTVRLVVYR